MRLLPALRLPVAGLAAIALVAGPAAADSHYAEDCYDGPVADASVERPHIWDDGEDTHAAAAHKEAMDLRAGWIAVDEEDGFTANIQVTAMPVHPLQATYNFAYTGPLGEHFVTAQATETLDWRFTFGHLEPDPDTGVNRQVRDGETTGDVDADAGVITIALPESAVPEAPTDGSEVKMPLLKMTSYQSFGTTATGGLLLETDSADWVCDAVLYEAEEPEEEAVADEQG